MSIAEQVILKGLIDESYFEKIDVTNVDWINVVDILIEKKLMLSLYPWIRKYISNEKLEYYDKIYKKIRLKVDKQVEEIKNIQNKLNEQGIETMFVKGVFLSMVAYNNPFARQCNDIDILVNREDMVKAYNSVYELGYRFLNGFDKNNIPKLSETPDYLFGEDYHEFRCLREDGNRNYVVIEIKYATSAIPYKFIKDFKDSFQIVDIEGVKIKTFDNPFTFIHICAHLYVNSQCEDGYINDRMFREFVDLKIFLCQHRDIDWKFICEKAKEYEITHQLYFALHSINLLWANTVSTEIVDYFSPRNITYDYNGNEFGELYTWKSDIVTRCFNEKLRLKEYSSLYKSDIFSDVTIPLINDDRSKHPFLLEKDAIQIPLFISYDSYNNCICLVILFDSEIFKKEDLYFFITLVDNDVSQELIERNISNPKEVCYTNVKGTWENYVHYKQGINFINIEAEDIFTNMCDKVCILIDIYKYIGNGGFRGTGVKDRYIVCNTTKRK